ncbi:MAG: hypothetical protein P4L53_08330 [Candidatus Obscuribacterales bacterium]|nr:hypothetical protein [Candidatus Obscuribacterales bacterium]
MQDPHLNNPAAYAWQDLDQQPLDEKQNAATSPDASRKRLSLDTLTRGAGAIASMSPIALNADRQNKSDANAGLESLPVNIQPWPSELTKANKISAKGFVRTETQINAYTQRASTPVEHESSVADTPKAIAYAAWGLDLEAETKELPVEKSRAFREMHEAEATIPVHDHVALIRQTEALSGPMQTPYTELLLLNDDEIAFTNPPEKQAVAAPVEKAEVAIVAPEKIAVAPEKKLSPEAILNGVDIKHELQKFKGDGVAFVKTIDPSGLRIQVQTAKDFSTLTETWMPGENGKYFYNMELQDHLKRKVHEESVNLMGARTVVQTIYDSNSPNVVHKVMTKPDGTVQLLDA